MNEAQTLSEDQLGAITRFAARAGRNWKYMLNSAWATGKDEAMRDGPLLRQVRNEFGPVWLNKFKINATVTKFSVKKHRDPYDNSIVEDQYIYRGVVIERDSSNRGYWGHWNCRLGAIGRNDFRQVRTETRAQILKEIDDYLEKALAC